MPPNLTLLAFRAAARIRGMSYDLPDHLITLKRDFLATEARLEELSKGGDDEKWQAAYKELQDLAVELDGHPYWATVDNRYQAGMALLAAAKEAAA